MEKIIIVVVAAAVIVCSATAFKTSSAYFVDEDEAVNQLNIGNVDITINEDFPDPGELEAGDTFKKEVSVSNTGICDCYIRAKVILSNEKLGQYITMDFDQTNWVGKDGYWYYKSIVPVGEETTKLIKQVTLSDETPVEAIDDLDIYVYCEAWQSEGFETYTDAWDFASHNK